MNKAHVNEVGLVIGSLMGLFHLVWALLVAIGVAQALMDFIFNVHMTGERDRISQYDSIADPAVMGNMRVSH